MKLDFWVSLFCAPQRVGIYVGWVDVKGFLIMPALRKSTHHSKESTGKQIKSICLSFWWVGVINHLLYRHPAIANPPYDCAHGHSFDKKNRQSAEFQTRCFWGEDISWSNKGRGYGCG